jgi:hypothetical protein
MDSGDDRCDYNSRMSNLDMFTVKIRTLASFLHSRPVGDPTMLHVLRLSLSLFGIGAIAAGLGFALAPERLALEFALSPVGVAGLGSLRADLGGCFIALGGFTLLGLRSGQERWLDVPLAMLGLFLILRLFHLSIDGISDGGIRSTVVEIVLLAQLALGRRLLSDSREGFTRPEF